LLKRLTSEDSELLREAFNWDRDAPPWFQAANTAFGANDLDVFLARDAVFIGVFDTELIAVIVLTMIAPHIFRADLLAQRRADTVTIAAGASIVISDFLSMGMKFGYCWVAEKNLGVRKVCGSIGLTHNGLTLYRGSYRGRDIKWLCYSIQPIAATTEIAA
jgi:hypothetical protein